MLAVLRTARRANLCLDYRVRLSIYEGPMDLLWFLVRRHELDVYDIPVATITDQYLEYLALMELLDIELAGDFMVTAAQLLLLKSRSLLPTRDQDEDDAAGDEERLDPHRELARRLSEYRRFKETAGTLGQRIEVQSRMFGRAWDEGHEQASDTVPLQSLSVFDLVTVFKKMLLTARPEEPTVIQRQTLTVSGRMEYIQRRVRESPHGLSFLDTVSESPTKIEVIVTFLAILELIRRGRISVEQRSMQDEIRIYPVARAA